MSNIFAKTFPAAVSATAAMALVVAAPTPARAVDLFNNLDLPTEDGLLPGASNRRYAQQFILDDSAGIDSVTLSLFGGRDEFDDFGTPTGVVNVEIWGDDANFPTASLGSVGILDLNTTPITNTEAQLETFDEPLLGLNGNQPYWVVLNFEDANVDFFESIGWNATSSAEGTNGAAKALLSIDSGSSWDISSELLGSETLNYFQASVSSTSVSVPEPSAVFGSFIVLGLCGALKCKMSD
ncbi:MAG: choice-of-anchor R domain-containing protein [Phormidesmis sp.]